MTKQQLKRMPVYAAIFVLIFFISQILFTPGMTDTSVRMQFASTVNDEYQLFYKVDETADYTEELSCKQAVVGNPKSQEIKFDLSGIDYETIRMDFGTNPNAEIVIHEIRLIQLENAAVYDADQLSQMIADGTISLHDMTVKTASADMLCLQSTGSDPFMEFHDITMAPMKADKPIAAPLLIAIVLTVLIYRYVYLKEIAIFFKDLYQNRGLILSLAKNDFKSKYTGSYFGIVWAFVQPVCTILVFWFVFEIGFRSAPVSDIPFALWLSCGLVPWFFFSEAWNGATNAFMEYNYLVKKVVFKISVLPVVKILSALLVHCFFIVFLFALFACYQIYPTAAALQILYYAFCMCALVVALSFITASIVVFFKDLGQIIAIILQFGMWLTPIMWSIDIMPAKFLGIIKMNPMYYIVDGYRNAMIYGQPLFYDVKLTLYFWVVTISLFVIGIVLFRKLRPHFADVL